MLLGVDGYCYGAITATATRGEFAHDLDGQISDSDLLKDLIATELAGDQGWHPANPASANSLDPNGLPAFTEGDGEIGSGLTGLLNDFPGAGVPTKLLEYDLGGTFDLDQINILTGNANDADGRIFSTFVIRVSTNNGASYSPLGGIVPNFGGGFTTNNFGYYQSDASGLINNVTGIPGTTEDMANLVEISDDGAAPIATGVTNLQIDFYSVDNTLGEMRDPFDGPNPLSGLDDGLSAAFVSPLVWEIDVFGQAATPANADFDSDDDVDGKDFLTWQDNFPITDGTAQLGDGDANDDGNVNDVDLGIWDTQYGPVGPLAGLASVPEPTGAVLTVIAFAYVAATMRRGTLDASSLTWLSK